MDYELYEAMKKFIPDSKRANKDSSSHDMAEILGWNDCVLEMNKRLADMVLGITTKKEE